VRKAAGAAYLAAAGAFNKAETVLNKKYAIFGTLARARAYYRADIALRSAFITELKKIVPPADTAADLHTLIGREATEQALEVEGSGVTTAAHLTSVQSASVGADRAAIGAANLVRSDLGLPPVPLLHWRDRRADPKRHLNRVAVWFAMIVGLGILDVAVDPDGRRDRGYAL
jgi:hypothetical protein